MRFFKFPYTSFQQINLDWIMKTLNQLKDAIPLVQQASPIYTQALEALDAANEAVETVTEQAAGAVTTANAAQYTAAQARTVSEQANTTAQSAQTTAETASDISTSARDTSINALANANQALNIATAAANALEWGYLGQYDIKDAENHRDITTPSIDITDLKSGLLLEIVDPFDYYGTGTIVFPALSLRGEIPNYYYYNTNYFNFVYSPLGSQTSLRFRITVTHTTEILEAQTRHYVNFRFSKVSAYGLGANDCYINIYRC